MLVKLFGLSLNVLNDNKKINCHQQGIAKSGAEELH
jgi:hypothetical protein